ncbi:MAG: hypothetical protein SFX72_19940 [Isosphaeraceae bacterium]|nr:hypothetical protein [Isosphaeraceae bacterium]
MDGRRRIFAILGLVLLTIIESAGCRSTGNEVPRGRRNRRPPEPGSPAVEFSTQPPEARGMPGEGPLGGSFGNVGPATAGSSGLPGYGTSGAGGFGPPGSAGLGEGMGGALGSAPPKLGSGLSGGSGSPLGAPGGSPLPDFAPSRP